MTTNNSQPEQLSFGIEGLPSSRPIGTSDSPPKVSYGGQAGGGLPSQTLALAGEGQQGNGKASKQGFYSDAVPSDKLEKMEQATDFKDLESEIAFMRVKLLGWVSSPGTEDELLLRAMQILVRMMAVNEKLKYGYWRG